MQEYYMCVYIYIYRENKQEGHSNKVIQGLEMIPGLRVLAAQTRGLELESSATT